MGAPWYVEFFERDYLEVYADVHEPERAAREAAFAAGALGLRAGQRVLDLCCGVGRHSAALAAQGFRTVALDLHHGSLRRVPNAGSVAPPGASGAIGAARPDGCASGRAGAGATPVRADMRELPLRSASLDGAVSLFSSFGYLETDLEDERVLRELARALRPGARLFLDLLNRENALAGFVETTQREGPPLVIERRAVDLLRSRLSVSFLIAGPDGTQRESVGHSLRLYTLTELAAMLSRAGLTLDRTFGNFRGEPYSLTSERLIALASKT